ncbi:MAG: biotin--[acetyl-CoA-carboxylase] ligase [Deltaproteobacteria bacterium]|nr:biotin--[acetyl-CoA-carboxylase] ligase [Deltaproteobacteria bacterium]
MAREARKSTSESVALDQVQQDLLLMLKQTESYLSGEQLGVRLSLSRTAVWKRIQRLRGWGYQVEGSSRRGYRLHPGQDLLLPAEISRDLIALRLRGPVRHFVTVPSTNDAAKDWARQGCPEGAVLVAETQSAGRGRLGRVWESPPGTGIYLSIVLRPPLPPLELPKLTLTAAVAVAAAIKGATGIRVGIKWPNDLIFGGKKMGGILTEMETESDRMSHVILGVGLNINTSTFPEHLATTATSLAGPGQSYSRLAIFRAFLKEMDVFYDRFLRQEFPAILDLWRQAAVTLGRPVRVERGDLVITGLAVDVAPDGALLVEKPGGEIEKILSGEIHEAS